MRLETDCAVVTALALLAFGAWAQDGPADPELAAARQTRDALVAAADFTAALAPAEQAVELASGDDNYYIDLLHLARVQAELGRFEDAETHYLAAIADLEEREGQNSASLIEPYQGLGRSYINSRRFAEAITVLEHAREISQRNTGLFNIDQSDLIDDITMAYLGQGNTVEARELQLRRLENAERHFGQGDPALVPFYHHLGEYYDNSRLRASAREQYEKALAIQESQNDVNASGLLESLRKLVQVELMLGDGDEARMRLEQALIEHPDLGPVDRGISLALLGDCAIVAADHVAAAEYYRQAFDTLEAANAIQAQEYFSQPAMIDFIPPLSAVDRNLRSDPYAWGLIVLRFDVTAEGRAVDVETVQVEPAGDAADAYIRRVRETRFRPRLDNGVPAATEGVEFSHYFRYYVRERRR